MISTGRYERLCGARGMIKWRAMSRIGIGGVMQSIGPGFEPIDLDIELAELSTGIVVI